VIKYVSLDFSTSLLRLQPYRVTADVYAISEQLVASIRAAMPGGLKSILNVSGMGEYGRVWDYLAVQEALKQGLFTGTLNPFALYRGIGDYRS
jgi:hypothetical protein